MAEPTTKKSAQGASDTVKPVSRVDYRMKDLIRESGLPRKTIHYYINEGLLPPPRKSGRNTAIYGQEHLERLQEICMLRGRRFLPVKAIKAFYDDSAETDLTSEQKKFIRELRLDLPDSIRPGSEQYVSFNSAAKDVTAKELKVLEKEGLITLVDSGSERVLSKEDAVILESWAQFKEIGFTPEKGYDPSMLKIWDTTIEQLVVMEIAELADGISRSSQAETVDVTNKAMSIVNKLIEALHYKKTRAQFKKMQEEAE